METRKEIVYDRETRDYACYLNGELVEYARTYHDGEMLLNQLALQMLQAEATYRYQFLDEVSS